MTNGDRIRNMTDEELADVVMLRDCKSDKAECPMWRAETSSCITMCRAAFVEWLKQEAKQE